MCTKKISYLAMPMKILTKEKDSSSRNRLLRINHLKNSDMLSDEFLFKSVMFKKIIKAERHTDEKQRCLHSL